LLDRYVNIDKSIRHFRLAAAQGHSDAQLEFADLIVNNPTDDSETNALPVSYLCDLADNDSLDAIVLYATVLDAFARDSSAPPEKEIHDH
jgi:TPR repeat protein